MFAEKRVIDTERMMEMLQVSTIPVKTMSDREIASFEKRHGKFKTTENAYVSFLRVAGFILASVTFTEEKKGGERYTDVTSIRIDQLNPSKLRLIRRVFEEVETFSMKKGIPLVSITSVVMNIFSIRDLGFLPVRDGEVSYTKDYIGYFGFMREYDMFKRGYKRNNKANFSEGVFNKEMMNFLYSLNGRYDVDIMAVAHNSPFEKLGEQFKTFEPIFFDNHKVRFSKKIVRSPEEIVSQMVNNKNSLKRKRSESDDFVSNSAQLITMLSPFIYDIKGKDLEGRLTQIGSFVEFGEICAGGVEPSFVDMSLESADYVLTYETGGTLLAFGSLRHFDDEESVKLQVLCARPSAGLGSRLLKEIEAFSLKIGSKSVKIDSVPEKIDWYKSQGYEHQERYSYSGTPMIKKF